MNEKRQASDSDKELLDILTAISVVSKRLARNLTILAAQSISKEGEKKRMSKMSEMASTIEELRKCAAVISDAANWLTEQFSTIEQEPEAKPTEPVLTLEAVTYKEAFTEAMFRASASNSQKAELAMQMLFENTEQYAGNFARESTQTISGSLGLMKAALGSFTAGLGKANADMTNLTQNLVDAFQAIVQNIVPVLENVVSALPVATGAIITAIPQLIDAGVKLLVALIQALPQIIATVVTAIPQIMGALTGAFVGNIDKIILAGVQLLVALIKNLPTIIIEAVKAVPKIITALVNEFTSSISQIATVGGNLIKGLWQGISDAGAWLRNKISGFFGGVVTLRNRWR